MMIGVARLVVSRQRAVRKHRMLRTVQHDLVFGRSVQRGIHRQPRLHVHVADRRRVFRAGHQLPGNLHRAKRLTRVAIARCARTEYHRGLDPRVREFLSAQRQLFAADGLCRDRAERMARHTDPFQIEPARQRVGLPIVPGFKLIQHDANVLDAQQEILHRRRLVQRLHAFLHRRIFPDRIVAAGMLQKHRHIPARRPMLAQELTPGSRTAQAMAEQNHRRRCLGRRQINPHWDVAVAGRIMHRQLQLRWPRRRIDRQRVIRRATACADCHQNQQHQHQRHRAPSHLFLRLHRGAIWTSFRV